MKVGFIGTGAIASAMVRGLVGQGHEIWVSARGEATSKALAAEFAEVHRASNDRIAEGCEVVVLCLMATVAKQVLPSLSFGPGVRVISVMVDVDLATLRGFAPEAASIDMTIPLPQIASGGCPLPCFPRRETVADLFGPANPSFVVKDMRALNAHFAASALMSTTLDQIATGAAWLSGYSDDEAAAQFYLAHMLASALVTIGKPTSLAHLLAELSTEGGLNATLKAHMRTRGAPAALRDGLDAFTARLGL